MCSHLGQKKRFPRIRRESVRPRTRCGSGNLPAQMPMMVPIETPLTFSGFNDNVLREFGPLFQNLGVTAVQGGGEHRPSMGQDMVKGRRTEIEFLNGLIVRKGDEIGLPTPANAALTDIVKRVEKGELKPDPKHLIGLRLN